MSVDARTPLYVAARGKSPGCGQNVRNSEKQFLNEASER